MLEAFAHLAQRHPKLKLILFGSAGVNPEREKRYNAQVRQLGIADRVVRTGFVSEQTLATLYSKSAMFVFPSIYEGFGYPVLEAMSAGACVICGRVSSMTEIAEGAGVLVDQCEPGDLSRAIEKLLCNPEQRQRLGTAAEVKAVTFSIEQMVEKTLAVYESTLAR